MVNRWAAVPGVRPVLCGGRAKGMRAADAEALPPRVLRVSVLSCERCEAVHSVAMRATLHTRMDAYDLFLGQQVSVQ